MLREIDHIPEGLLQLDASQLASALGGPTLIHLPGRREPALFVSVLMHGNETTGWEAIRRLLQRYDAAAGELPRALSLFIGNVAAAEQGLRRLDTQPDYNRVWPGCEDSSGTPEHRLMEQVIAIMQARGVFASVDVHNNTGLNPHYGCINVIDHRFLHLASLFSRTVVYFTRPCGVQSLAMSKLCPAVTLECGKPDQSHGVEHAIEYLNACLHLAAFPQHVPSSHDIDLFHTVAVVKVDESCDFGFAEDGVTADWDISFAGDLDQLNFRELSAGTHIARVHSNSLGLQARDELGRDVTARYFEMEGEEVLLATAAMPSMLTRDVRVIRQDCFCYLMERYDEHLQDGEL